MENPRFPWTLRLLFFNVAVLVLAAGCITNTDHSYNKDYNQNLASAPNYSIENINDTSFKLVVHQGSPLPGAQRIVELKQAAAAVAQTEAQRRGWQSWDLNFIQDRDQGWMHIYIGVVTKKNPVQLIGTTNAPAGGNP
jgi:hypothetical protein